MSQDLLWIDLVKSHISYIRKRKDPSSSKLIFDKRLDHTNINPFYSISSKVVIQQSLNQNQVTTHTLLKRNKKCQSFIILSSIDILESPCKYAIKMLIVRVLFSFALCKTHRHKRQYCIVIQGMLEGVWTVENKLFFCWTVENKLKSKIFSSLMKCYITWSASANAIASATNYYGHSHKVTLGHFEPKWLCGGANYAKTVELT